MASCDDDTSVAVHGRKRTIQYAMCANGSMPAKEFVESLSQGEQTKLAVLFKRMADTGEIRNREQYKKVEGDIWEFKRHQVRVMCFQVRKRVILTHGFRKKANRTPRSEIERAKRIRAEHLRREGTHG